MNKNLFNVKIIVLNFTT